MERTSSWPAPSNLPRSSGLRALYRRHWRRWRLTERSARPYWTTILLFGLLLLACCAPLTQMLR